MFFRKTADRRTHPYVALTIGTLAMIGAAQVVRCVKRTGRCVKNKMSVVLHGSNDGMDQMI